MVLFRSTSLTVLTVILPLTIFGVMMSDVSGCGAAPEGRVLDVKSGGDLYLVSDGELSSGASIYFHILLDLPSDRRKCLDGGETIRVIEIPTGEIHAKVAILSGSHQGNIGWVHRDLITPKWYKAAVRNIVNILILLFIYVMLISVAKIIRWVNASQFAIDARSSIEG